MPALYDQEKCVCNFVIHILHADRAGKHQEVIVKTPKSSRQVRGLTGEELIALPAVIDLDTANRALQIGRSTGYGLAKHGRYPVKVLRLGNAYRVVTADLLQLLGLQRQPVNPEFGEDEQHDLCA
jgi:hypothetical protein